MKSLPSSFLPSFVISFLSFSYSYLYRATQTDTTCVYEKGRGLVSEWERTSGRPRRGPNPPDFKAGTFFVLSDITNTHSLSLSLPLSFFLSISHLLVLPQLILKFPSIHLSLSLFLTHRLSHLHFGCWWKSIKVVNWNLNIFKENFSTFR